MLTRFGSQGQLRFLKFANGRNRPAEFLSISQARQIWLCSHFAVHPHVPRAGEEGTMNIPGMMGRGGMMGGAPQASSGDTPQVDTAENVQISSLALLKMLKHGTWRDRATPRARRESRADRSSTTNPSPKPPTPRAGVAANARHGRNAREAPIGRVTPEGVFEPFGASAFRRFAAFGATGTHPRFFSTCFSIRRRPSRRRRADLSFPFSDLRLSVSRPT